MPHPVSPIAANPAPPGPPDPAPPPARARWRGRGAEHGGVLLAYTVLTGLLTWPLITVFTTQLPDGSDGAQFLWDLWWVKTALVTLHTSPFHTDLLYYPYGVSLYFDTLVPLLGVISIPFQLAGLPLPAVYNLLVGQGFVGAGYGTYLLVRYLTGQRRAAFVAGIVFTFCPYHFAHLHGQLNLISIQWLPLYVLALLKAWGPDVPAGAAGARDAPNWSNSLRWAAVAGGWLAVTAYTEWLHVLFLGLFTAWFAAWRLLRHPSRARLGAGAVRRGVTGGVALGLVSPVLWPMVQEARTATYMQPGAGESFFYSSDLTDAFMPNLLHPFWPDRGLAVLLHYLGRPPAELIVSVGTLVLMLSCLALWRLRRPAVAFWGWTALGAWVLSLGPTLQVWGRTDFGGVSVPLPYTLLNVIPFFTIFRVPSRLMVLTMLALAVLVGYALAAGAAARGPGWGARLARHPWTAGVVGLLILAEFLPVPIPLLTPHDDAAFYAAVAQEPGPFALLDLPLAPVPATLTDQLIHHQPIIGGYLSRQPPDPFVRDTPVLRYLLPATPPDDPLAAEAARTGLAALRAAQVRYVVVHWWAVGGADRAILQAKLARIFPGLPSRPLPAAQMEVYPLQP